MAGKAATKKAKKAQKPKKATRAAPKRSPATSAAAARAGDRDVQRYLEALPAWQRTLALRFDRLLAREVPGAARVIKWGLPFYGVPGRGWFVSCGGFPKAVKLTFFQGASLRPLPPIGKGRQLRALDLAQGEPFDEARIAGWIRQAALLPGFGK